ncbi:MAG TPA: SpoIIE family protein phosphatase [Phycisphaerae bacterium]|nr:SpoIIE family protein phosphatase [Phycisphaerae bacterium]
MQMLILETRRDASGNVEKRLRNTVRPTTAVISVGSNPSCAIHLPDPRVSQLQANILRSEDGAWWLEVVDSSVPTNLNRHRLVGDATQKARAKLRHADEIEVGPFSIRLFMEAEKSREDQQRERMQALSKQHGESLPLGAIVQLTDAPVTLSKEQLEQLTLLGLKLGTVETIRDLMPAVLRAMLRLVDGRRAWIGVRSDARKPFEWALGVSNDGQPCERPPFASTMEARCLNNTQYICCPEAPVAEAHSAMGVPLACQGGNLGMLYIENGKGDAAYSEESLGVLSALACCVARPVENTLRRSTARRQAVTSTEQTLARIAQDAITPKALPQWDEIQMAAYRHMGTARCCDYYDVVQLADKTAAMAVARLNVEGTATPRLFGEIHSAFRSATLHTDSPQIFCRTLNWLLFTGDGRWTIDLAAIWLNPKTGRLQVCQAGSGIDVRRLATNGQLSLLVSNPGPAIAASKQPAYESAAVELAMGDTLLLATAGILAAKSQDGRAMGMEPLIDVVADGLGDRPGSLLAEFAGELTEFVKNGEGPEDVSVVLMRWK